MDIKYDIEALIDIDGEDAPPRKRSFVCSFTPVSLVIPHTCGAWLLPLPSLAYIPYTQV